MSSCESNHVKIGDGHFTITGFDTAFVSLSNSSHGQWGQVDMTILMNPAHARSLAEALVKAALFAEAAAPQPSQDAADLPLFSQPPAESAAQAQQRTNNEYQDKMQKHQNYQANEAQPGNQEFPF